VYCNICLFNSYVSHVHVQYSVSLLWPVSQLNYHLVWVFHNLDMLFLIAYM
jgi:hypothetical protein